MNAVEMLLSQWSARLDDSAVIAQPVLPLVQWWMLAGWGLVLVALGLLLVGRLTRRVWVAWCLALFMAVMVWLPGAVSPVHWLGLAFQAPSLASAVVALFWLYRKMFVPQTTDSNGDWRSAAVAVMALGWLLLLDTFAVFPWSVYAWGFSPVAVFAAAALFVSVWGMAGHRKAVQPAALAVLLVLFVFVLLRLPTGNLWDALLDPWLWVFAHVHFVWAWRRSSLQEAR